MTGLKRLKAFKWLYISLFCSILVVKTVAQISVCPACARILSIILMFARIISRFRELQGNIPHCGVIPEFSYLEVIILVIGLSLKELFLGLLWVSPLECPDDILKVI